MGLLSVTCSHGVLDIDAERSANHNCRHGHFMSSVIRLSLLCTSRT